MNFQELKSFLSHNEEKLLVRQLCGFGKMRQVISKGYGYCFTPQVSF